MHAPTCPVIIWSQWARINLAWAAIDLLRGKPVPIGLTDNVAELVMVASSPPVRASLTLFGGGDS